MAGIAAYIDFGEDEGIDASEVVTALDRVRLLRAELLSHIDDSKCGERVVRGVIYHFLPLVHLYHCT